MTAPALTALATGDHQPWCVEHHGTTCYSAPDLIPNVDGGHFGQLIVEAHDDGTLLASLDVGMVALDETGLLDLAAKATAAAARIAQARR